MTRRRQATSMAKNDRTTTIEHRKNNTTYNKRTKAAKPNPNLKLEKKNEKNAKRKQNQSCSFFFFGIGSLFFRFCFTLFFLFLFVFFYVFFHFCFRFFSTSCLHVRRSRSSGHLRKEKHDKTSGKKNGEKKQRKKTDKKKNEKKPTAYKCISGLPLFAFFAFIKIVVCFFFPLFLLFSKRFKKWFVFFALVFAFLFSNSLEVGSRHFTTRVFHVVTGTSIASLRLQTLWVCCTSNRCVADLRGTVRII